MPGTEPDPPAFVESVRRHFEAAVDRVGAIDLDLRIAGQVLRLSFAGEALVPRLWPAFGHLAVRDPSVEPDMVFQIWDSRSTATPLPPPPWSWDRYCTRGDIDGYNTADVRTAYAGSLNVFDTTTDVACWWVPAADAVPASESGAPLRVLLAWWLESRGLQLVHGACVGPGSGGGVLLAGEGGAGKSSTALACLGAGWSFVGDDYCVVDMTDRPVAHGLYATAKADEAARRRAGGVAVSHEVRLADRGKSLLFLAPDYAEQLATSLPIDAVLLPRVVDRERSILRPAGALETTRALAESTLRQLPAAGDQTWRTLAKLARSVPAQHLELGRDARTIPDVLAAAIAGEGLVA